jgi:hypothetical protein
MVYTSTDHPTPRSQREMGSLVSTFERAIEAAGLRVVPRSTMEMVSSLV